jgi:2-oxoglutarate ferredoxin oxidoreductase subunit beta
LEDENHDLTNKRKALQKAFEWGDRIPIGIFYKKDRPTYRDNLPHLKDIKLTKMTKEKVDISHLINEMK